MTINVPITLTPEDINDIICTAIEGGITYWCESYMGYGDGKSPIGQDINYDYEWLGFGGYLTLEEDKSELDSENFDGDGNYKYTGMTHRLDLDLFKAGLEKWISSQTFKPGEAFDIGDIDAGDADSIVQYAIFGELKYG